MRQGLIISLTVIVTTTLTILSMNVINRLAVSNNAGHAQASMDIMEMMKSTRNLPSEAFEAH